LSQIKVEAFNDRTDARVLRLDLPSKRARTPQRALTAKIGGVSELSLLSDEINIAEIYKNISVEKLDDINGDKDKQDDFTRDYLRPIGAIRPNTIVVGIFEINTSKQSLEARHIDYISDLVAAPQVDVVATPLFSPKGNNEAWFNLTKRFVENVSDKSIIASIPTMPHEHVGSFVERLLKLDIRIFALDFNGTNPTSNTKYPQVRAIKRVFKSVEKDSDALLLYGFNVKYGKIVSPASVVPAGDMVSPAFGVDIFGTNHKRAFPKVPLAKPVLRVFDDRTYFYRDLNNPAQASLIQDLPSCKFSTQRFSVIVDPREKNDYLKCVNAERQTRELINVKRTIEDNSTHEYLNSKEGIRNERNLQRLFDEHRSHTSLLDLL